MLLHIANYDPRVLLGKLYILLFKNELKKKKNICHMS